jgi:enediyne polyketide synthase
VLVHGATSRAVEAYLLIGAQRCAARLHCYPARWFAQELPQLQVLGTPALWDSMIHAVQVCVPDVPLSPTRIGRIRLAPHLVETAKVTMAAVELAQDGGRHVYEVSAIDETGAVVAAIEGLEFTVAAQAVEPDAWPPGLAGPVLQRRLLQLVPERIQVAVVRDLVQQVDDSGSRRVPSRREASCRALSVAMGRPVDLRYRDDGRPDTAGEAMSVSHTASMTLAVTCPVPIGCDMEEVRERAFAAWSDILGMSGVALAEMVGVATNEPFEHAATRVWSAREAVSKLGVTVLRPRLSLDSELIGDGWLALRHGSDLVWTTAMAVDDGQVPRTMVFAFAQKS